MADNSFRTISAWRRGIADITFMRFWVWLILVSIHLLAGAAWFGAMIYSLMVLHPRAKRFFDEDDEQFEALIATVSQGARWKVLAVLGVIGGSGAALIPFAVWHRGLGALLIVKTALLIAAVGIFCYASWRLWPVRIFALPGETEAIRGRFRMVAITLIGIAAAAMVLGVWAHGE